MKILITHINPHLDDLAAIWLYKKFYQEFQEADLQFLSASSHAVTWQNNPVDIDPDVIHFGIGRGKFDEHKGDLNESATSLVWKEIVNTLRVPTDEITKNALEKLVNWVTLEDTGRLPLGEYPEFSVPAFIRPLDDSKEGSKKAVALSSEILDRILKVLLKKEQAIKDWVGRVEFESKFGKSVAVISNSVDRVFCKIQGGDLFLMYDPKFGSVQFFTPKDLDLEPIYNKVKNLDPAADWFLHQSHHMVLCGSGAAPDSKKTKLSFEQLIEVARQV